MCRCECPARVCVCVSCVSCPGVCGHASHSLKSYLYVILCLRNSGLGVRGPAGRVESETTRETLGTLGSRGHGGGGGQCPVALRAGGSRETRELASPLKRHQRDTRTRAAFVLSSEREKCVNAARTGTRSRIQRFSLSTFYCKKNADKDEKKSHQPTNTQHGDRPPNQCQPSSDVVVLPKEFFLADLSRLLLSHAPRLRFGRGFRPSRLYLRPRRQGCGLRSLD